MPIVTGALPSMRLVRPILTSSRCARCAAGCIATLRCSRVAAVARYEITSAEFTAALRRYDHDAYGSGAPLTS